jgi:4-hydroxybenzoate polyprenyltransferase
MMETSDDIWKSLTDSKEYKYVKNTTLYGEFKVWHLILFAILGPMLTWPMLVLLLLLGFTTKTMNFVKGVKDVKSSTNNNG